MDGASRCCEFRRCQLFQTLRAGRFLQLWFRLFPWLLLYLLRALFDEIDLLQLFQETHQVYIVEGFDYLVDFLLGLICIFCKLLVQLQIYFLHFLEVIFDIDQVMWQPFWAFLGLMLAFWLLWSRFLVVLVWVAALVSLLLRRHLQLMCQTDHWHALHDALPFIFLQQRLLFDLYFFLRLSRASQRQMLKQQAVPADRLLTALAIELNLLLRSTFALPNILVNLAAGQAINLQNFH